MSGNKTSGNKTSGKVTIAIYMEFIGLDITKRPEVMPTRRSYESIIGIVNLRGQNLSYTVCKSLKDMQKLHDSTFSRKKRPVVIHWFKAKVLKTDRSKLSWLTPGAREVNYAITKDRSVQGTILDEEF